MASKSTSSLINLCKKDLRDVYQYALDAIRPDMLIKNSLAITKNHQLILRHYNADQPDFEVDLTDSNVHVVGGGKSALAMARGLAELVNQAGANRYFSHGSLSLPIGLKTSHNIDFEGRNLLSLLGIRCLFGTSNNLPDEDSVLASRSLLTEVAIACQRDRIEKRKPIFIVLLSGGGSACLANPRFISLDQKLDLIKFLVQKGADIVELNKVRRYFSNIKGGKLARHILKQHPDSCVLSLILSDVIGDPIEYIASGPTYLENSNEISDHKQAAFDILRKYNYGGTNSLSIEINGILEPDEDLSERLVINRIIGNNERALQAVGNRAQQLGYKVRSLGNCLLGSSDEIVDRICRSIDGLETSSDKILVIGGGEATVVCESGQTWGAGGRLQEMALDYIIRKMKSGISKHEIDSSDSLIYPDELSDGQYIDVFLAGSTDGQDGSTDVAACMASHAELANSDLDFTLQSVQAAKREHDSYTFWTKYRPDCLIKTGLTGTNVMDLYFYLVMRTKN